VDDDEAPSCPSPPPAAAPLAEDRRTPASHDLGGAGPGGRRRPWASSLGGRLGAGAGVSGSWRIWRRAGGTLGAACPCGTSDDWPAADEGWLALPRLALRRSASSWLTVRLC